MVTSICKRCGVPLWVTFYAQSRDEATPLRCKRCGAVSSYKDGSVDIISPPCRALEFTGTERRSPWHPHYTRPVESGHYEVRFGTWEGMMFWDGIRFRVARGNPTMVYMRYFTSWRGKWEQVND